MKLVIQTPKKALKPFLKQKPLRSEIDIFKANLISLLDKINIIEKRPSDETEEHLKNDLRDFLRDTYYRNTNAINTKDKKDLVIHLGKTTDSDVAVIIEAKRPNNSHEMVSPDNPNKKALHELILYYLNERSEKNKTGNIQLKQLAITNVNEWYIIDANQFDKHIYRNKQIKNLYQTYLNDKKDNPFFYEEIARIIANLSVEIPCVYFNIKDYEKELRNNNKEDDRELIALYKILSPQHFLKIVTPNDSNALDDKFYKELLHIIGLEEAKENGKNIIRRKREPDTGSLIETTIEALNTEDVLHHLPDQAVYGETKEERIYNVSLELCITWINRILFLKLLEGQLLNYHGGNKEYCFLYSENINDFDELFNLFHKVLAVNITDRSTALKNKYAKIPYLNSSLFEISELEDQTIKINSLGNGGQLKLHPLTILKDTKKHIDQLPVLDYLFRFLDAYDFASEGTQDIQEDKKTIINASVLGKVFEKINGYKDGSIFTPSFITMYMCKQSIRLAVVEKFNKYFGTATSDKLFDKFEDVKNYTTSHYKTHDILTHNEIINSLRICDLAVGSGHFLVSVLNEIISIKAELGILATAKGNSISGYEIEIIDDELIITDPRNKDSTLEYKMRDGKPISKEVQLLQKTLFHEKQIIIENCLFGVDINQNSVKICRLRLWIELLKNAYYKEDTDYTELETLPNIDINIKCGNSLLSRFPLDADLSNALKSIKYDIKAYREFVSDYKNEKNRDIKRGLQKIITGIKNDFVSHIYLGDPKRKKLISKTDDLNNLLNQTRLFPVDAKQKKQQNDKQQKLEKEITQLSKELNEIKNNVGYRNAFEWRFEFPEVLTNDGDFEGFDVIIGNPPYIQLQKLNTSIKKALELQGYETFTKTGDIYQLFYEKGIKLLKPNGQLSYITSNKWMRTDYGSVTRKFLATSCNTRLVVDFGMAQMFDSATTYTNILLLSKISPTGTITMCRLKDDYDQTVLLEDYVDFASVTMENPGENSWIAYDKNEYELIKKIVAIGKPLKEWDIQINYGLKTGLNEAFIINTETRNKLIELDSKSKEIIKPLLRGEDIKAYIPEWANLWLIYIPWHFPLHLDPSISGNSEKAEKMFAEQYPAVFNHLEQYKSKLSARNKAETGIRYEWYALQRWGANYYKDFLKPKIIYPNMTKFMPFVYDKHQFFTNDKSFILTGNGLEYLVAFLNSKLFKFTFKEYFPELLGETRELRKVFFENITIKPVDDEDWYRKMCALIINNKEKKISTTGLEKEIDDKIFNLYGLTEEERSLILKTVDPEGISEDSIKSISVSDKV